VVASPAWPGDRGLGRWADAPRPGPASFAGAVSAADAGAAACVRPRPESCGTAVELPQVRAIGQLYPQQYRVAPRCGGGGTRSDPRGPGPLAEFLASLRTALPREGKGGISFMRLNKRLLPLSQVDVKYLLALDDLDRQA